MKLYIYLNTDYIFIGCEYGDNDVNFCSNLPAHKCYAHEKTCCATCAAVDSGNKGELDPSIST